MRSTGKSEIVDAEAAGGPPDENESQQQPSGSNTNTNILRTATLAVKKTVGTVATVTAATCNTVTDGIVLRKRYRPVSKTQTDTIENNNNSSTIGSSDETIMTMNTEKGDVAVATLRTGDAIMKSDRRFSSLLLSSSGDSFAETFETKTVASSSSTETPFSLKSVVTIGPFLEFLTADATLFFVFAFSASLYPTFEHWSLIWNSDNGLFLRTAPMATIVLSWVFAAFACGVAVGQYFDSHWLLSVINPFQVADLDSNISTNQRPYGTERIVREENEAEDMQQVKQSKHILFLGLMGKNRSSKVMFRRSKVPHIPKMEEVTSKAWSMLNNGNSSRKINRQARLSWQLDVDPTKDANSFLARTVLKRFHLRKQVASSFKTIATEHIEEATKPEEDIRDSQIGAFDLASTTADSLKDFVIEPVFKLRGMDVFLSEEPESVVSSHPWLLKQGLRETPGFTVNTLTQWGNILVYFEVPHAIFHDPEKETDMDDVKAAKVRV